MTVLFQTFIEYHSHLTRHPPPPRATHKHTHHHHYGREVLFQIVSSKFWVKFSKKHVNLQCGKTSSNRLDLSFTTIHLFVFSDLEIRMIDYELCGCVRKNIWRHTYHNAWMYVVHMRTNIEYYFAFLQTTAQIPLDGC